MTPITNFGRRPQILLLRVFARELCVESWTSRTLPSLSMENFTIPPSHDPSRLKSFSSSFFSIPGDPASVSQPVNSSYYRNFCRKTSVHFQHSSKSSKHSTSTTNARDFSRSNSLLRVLGDFLLLHPSNPPHKIFLQANSQGSSRDDCTYSHHQSILPSNRACR